MAMRLSKKLSKRSVSSGDASTAAAANAGDDADINNTNNPPTPSPPPPAISQRSISLSASMPASMMMPSSSASSPSMTRKFKSVLMNSSSTNTSASSNYDGAAATNTGGYGGAVGGIHRPSSRSANTGTTATTTSRGHQQQQPFETSDGAHRFNRLLDSSNNTNNNNKGGTDHQNHHHASSTTSPLMGGASVLRKAMNNAAALGGSVSAGMGMGISHHTTSSSYSSSDVILGGSNHTNPSNNEDITTTTNNNNSSNSNNNTRNLYVDYIPPSTIHLPDPTDAHAVGEMTCRIVSKLRVDSKSIGGHLLSAEGKVEARTGNAILRENWEELVESSGDSDGIMPEGRGAGVGIKSTSMTKNHHSPSIRPMNRLTNECLFSMCVSQFDLSVGLYGGPSGGKKRHIPIAKTRNKLRYVVIVRSTNRPLLRPRPLGMDTFGGSTGGGGMGGGTGDELDHNDDDEDDDDDMMNDGDESDNGYDNMYNPDPSESGEGGGGGDGNSSAGGGRSEGESISIASSADKKKKKLRRGFSGGSGATDKKKSSKRKKHYEEYDCGIPSECEISSFPALFCLAIHADGTKPDVRKILELDKLVSIENVPPRRNAPPGSAGPVVLVFRNGDAVEIDCDLPNAVLHQVDLNSPVVAVGSGGRGGAGSASGGGGRGSKKNNSAIIDSTNRLRKDRFLWSLLQTHAMLCTSVVERSIGTAHHASLSSQLPPLVVRNVDRGELQYVSTMNGFLTDSPVLCALLDRQSNDRGGKAITPGSGGNAERRGSHHAEKGGSDNGNALSSEEGKLSDDMDGMAYDMMMGNYNRRVALFANEEEKRDAAIILNATPWQQQEITADGMSNVDGMGVTAESLVRLLQQAMRDLEAETCRRLISWEDEKYYSALSEQRPALSYGDKSNTTVNTMSVNDLFMTLQRLDDELEQMELWIQDRATMIKPITDECCGIEEENRMLEQQWVSYETLGLELKRLLGGLVLPPNLMKVLENPGSVIVYDRSTGAVDIKSSEQGVELIHQAGQALKLALDTAESQGGIHLRAVSDTAKVLSSSSTNFCGSLARIVVTVMEHMAKEICARPETTIGKGDTHNSIAKKIRETQRQFQASLLSYIKIIEVIALLKPDILPAVRDSYSELVAEGIMSKKRMKAYFASLPGRTSVKLASDANFDALGRTSSAFAMHDLSEYAPASLRYPSAPDTSGIMKPVNVEDIEAALAEMLPLIAREAYFTAALFGLSSRHLDGRQKKRNFEAAKKSVDHSSQHFRYYMNRICGIASEVDAEGKKVKGDAMLSLVASIHLNEAMDGYIDRNKKGGDHSLSLAYVRATILDMRKKVDKQWVIWVEDQIRWIRTNPGVPLNGKRAGIFASISRLPTYLDHVLICCKAGRPKDYTPNLAKIKVVSYYLQKMASSVFASLNECAERESTDQQYAANVMRMENSYFFTQSIKQRGIELTALFQKQITGASVICKQSTDAYLGWMIKREFKAMHSLFSNISRVRKEVGDADVPIHVPRAQFVRTLQKESSKEIMKEKIGVVYARMEKHLSESGGLLPVAWKALVKVLYEWFGRWEKLCTSCYKFILEPSAIDVVRIAKVASGSASSTGKRNVDGRSEKHKYVSV